jgi:hypothetical protein
MSDNNNETNETNENNETIETNETNENNENNETNENNEKKEGKKKEDEDDPSIAKIKNLKRLSDDPPKIPGLDVFTAEPKATLLATNLLDMILNRLSDPALAKNIMDNVSKTVELSLENKKNKIEYLKNDKGFKSKNNSMIINSIHNETLKQQPREVINHDNGTMTTTLPNQSIVVESDNEKANEPTAEANEPTAEANEPTAEANEPTAEANEPTKDGNQPTEDGNQPIDKKNKLIDKNKLIETNQIEASTVKIKGGRQPFFTEQECSFF